MKFQNIYKELDYCYDRITRLEQRILGLEEKIDQLIRLERNHLVRVKNHEEISDEYIESGRKYHDLPPDKAWKLYNSKDFDFIFIDVCEKNTRPTTPITEALHIPWSEFGERVTEIQSRTTPIIIISEDGTNSILACKLLAELGFYNCNNVSGGYKHWAGLKLMDSKKLSA